MTDKDFWQKNWKKVDIEKVNEFAKEVYEKIKNKKFKTLLEIGAGSGQDTVFFVRNGFDVTAIDYVKSSIEKIKKKIAQRDIQNCKLVLIDTRKLDFEDNTFDVIYSHLGLHYFDNVTTDAIFAKLHKMLKPDGMLFIKCKSTDDAKYGKGEKVGENMYYYLERTVHFFDEKYMKEKLKDFKIISVEKRESFYFDYDVNFIEAVATK